MEVERRALIVMAKEPRAGAVKTRLAPELSPAIAAALYRAFLLDVLESAEELPKVARYCLVDPPDAVDRMSELGGPRFTWLPQEGSSLAQRMIAGFATIFARGHREVVMRNSDSPTLPAPLLQDAFAALEAGIDVVLGPDLGGGYYLVGLREPRPGLFDSVPMSTSSVRAETTRRARALGLSLHELEPWLDVDVPADLERLRVELDPRRRGARARCARTEQFLLALPLLRREVAPGPERRGEKREPRGDTAIP